jgi:hypothetical protein
MADGEMKLPASGDFFTKSFSEISATIVLRSVAIYFLGKQIIFDI